jgi:hypothetical protein
LRDLRELWKANRAAEAKAHFQEEMLEENQADYLARFEANLGELATPIAKAWRKDGIRSRVAQSSFYRWLASDLWPAEVTDKELLEFAVSRELH